MPSLVQEFSCTRSAKWLREARTTYAYSWNDRLRCFEALDRILSPYRTARPDGQQWSQSPVDPPRLLKDVAHGAHFSSAESVYQRWRAQQCEDSIKRWAGNDPRIRPREAFLAEARLVSFWPYRAGVLAVADRFEMSLAEVAEAYLRAMARWAKNAPVLAACIPAGSPPCVCEDMDVLAARAVRRRSAIGAAGDTQARLAELADRVVSVILGDASITPSGAFDTIRDEASRLFSEPPDPVISRVSYALAELADQLLHRRADEEVLTQEQVLGLQADMGGLGFLLTSMTRDTAAEPGLERGR